MPPCGRRPWGWSGGRWMSTRRRPHGTDHAPRLAETGSPGSATGRGLRAGRRPRVGLQALSGASLGRGVAGALAAWDGSPLAPGTLLLAQDPGAVRLRLPAQPGPARRARVGRAELRRADP